ncbi:MAG: hypothetical protein D6794_11015, partial [Deltaproteobacteria bacterium]
SLDEGKLETKKMAMKLVKWLQGLGPDVLKRLRVHVSCREGEWSKIDKSAWEKLLLRKPRKESDNEEGSPSQFIELALLPLDPETIEDALHSNKIDPDRFFECLPANAQSLLQWPQSLRMLVDLYVDGSPISEKVQDVYRQVVEKRLQESNEVRQQKVAIPLESRLRVVRNLAMLSVLSARDVIATEDVNSDTEVDAGLVCNRIDEAREILGSELFESFTQGKYRFEDRYLASYLAAVEVDQRLSHRKVETETVFGLLLLENEGHIFIPRLRPITSWLAYINKGFRDRVLACAPELLISDEFPGVLDDAVKLQVWNWLKNTYGSREWFDDSRIRGNAWKLACNEVVDDIGRVISSPEQYGRDVRIFGLEILRRSTTKA